MCVRDSVFKSRFVVCPNDRRIDWSLKKSTKIITWSIYKNMNFSRKKVTAKIKISQKEERRKKVVR